VKTNLCYEIFTKPRTWTDTLVRSKQRKRDKRFVTWNVRSLYRAGSLPAAVRELARYKLDLVGVQEVRRDKEGTVKAGEYCFFYRKGVKINSWEHGLLYITE
jgi:hypothetical protein